MKLRLLVVHETKLSYSNVGSNRYPGYRNYTEEVDHPGRLQFFHQGEWKDVEEEHVYETTGEHYEGPLLLKGR